MSNSKNTPLVSLIMGSKSDWPTMQEAANILTELEINFEAQVISAHRTPDLMFEFAEQAEARGIEIIIAGAGGAAHLPGMVAAKTLLPVLGVPIKSKNLNGIDSLLSIAQMPGGVPVGTMAIGSAGAKNAGLFAASILANKYARYKKNINAYRENQKKSVLETNQLIHK